MQILNDDRSFLSFDWSDDILCIFKDLRLILIFWRIWINLMTGRLLFIGYIEVYDIISLYIVISPPSVTSVPMLFNNNPNLLVVL